MAQRDRETIMDKIAKWAFARDFNGTYKHYTKSFPFGIVDIQLSYDIVSKSAFVSVSIYGVTSEGNYVRIGQQKKLYEAEKAHSIDFYMRMLIDEVWMRYGNDILFSQKIKQL